MSKLALSFLLALALRGTPLFGLVQSDPLAFTCTFPKAMRLRFMKG